MAGMAAIRMIMRNSRKWEILNENISTLIKVIRVLSRSSVKMNEHNYKSSNNYRKHNL